MSLDYTISQLYEDIKISWIDKDDLDDYFYRCYGFLTTYCYGQFIFDEVELKIIKRYRSDTFDPTSDVIINKDLRYLFILLCCQKSDEILEVFNFILLPTDYLTLRSDTLNRQILITKNLLK